MTYILMMRSPSCIWPDFIVKNIATVTKQNPKELALGKTQSAVITCLQSFTPDISWNNVKAV